MKKIVCFAAMAAFGVLFIEGCTKQEGIATEVDGFSISVSTPGTKTVFDGDAYTVEWEEDDALGVVIDDGSEAELYKFTKSSGNTFTCADFVPVEGASYTYYVLYPYDEGFTVSDGVSSAVVNISSGTQSDLSVAGHIKTPLYGKATAQGTASPEIALAHAAAVVKINVANRSGAELEVSEVGLVSADESAVMSGTFSVDFETGGLTAAETSNTASSVLLDAEVLANESSADFYVAVAPFATTADLSVCVNDEEFEKNGLSYDFVAGKVYTTAVTCGTPEVAVEVAGSTLGTLTQTLEDENVYANLLSVSGDVDIAVQYNGTKYYLCPTDGTFQDGVAVKASLKKTTETHWSLPVTEGQYRFVYNKLNNTLTIYSPENKFNEPFTITWDVANNPDNGSVTTTVTTKLYMWGDPSWSGLSMGPKQSLADPQILVYDSQWNYSGRVAFSLDRGDDLNPKYDPGKPISSTNYKIDHSCVIAPPLKADGTKEGRLAIVKNVWMSADCGSDLRGGYWDLKSIDFIVFDLRNMRVKFITKAEL